ncbi:MAG TPA: NAD-dependent epimerase/dehydratase family protein [Desulfobacterales bacterium]|nr:NAD-dependent epimerase/dehydratase family protein [Desulfobacterales bacterium]
MKKKDDKPVLVTGATGYVGGRLIPALLEAGYTVRAMGRSLEKLACRPWGHHLDIELTYKARSPAQHLPLGMVPDISAPW